MGGISSPIYSTIVLSVAKLWSSHLCHSTFGDDCEACGKCNFPITILRLYIAYGPRQDINRFIPIVIKEGDQYLKNKDVDFKYDWHKYGIGTLFVILLYTIDILLSETSYRILTN